MASSSTAMRPFGRAQDLDVAFTDDNRPQLVTTLLSLCSENGDPDFWWKQTVGERVAALLRILAQTEGRSSELVATLQCTRAQCGNPFEITLPFDDLFAAAPTGDATQCNRVTLPSERSVVVRRPTGHDLREWSQASSASRSEGAAAMLDTLVVEGIVEPDDIPIIAEAMAAHDPLVAYVVSCVCPTCGVACDQHVDLEAVVLARLRARQCALFGEVHALASTYGWTESEVLAIAPARRAQYLELIERWS